MKKVRYYAILMLITGIAMGCDAKKDKEILFEQVMAIHDEVMPKMGDIMSLKAKLRKKTDSISQTESSRKQRLEQAIKELEEADEAMMQWMRNFQPQDTVSDQEKVITYYKQQKIEIQKVKIKMLEAIEEARELLNMNPKP